MRVVRLFLLSVIITGEMIMGANGLLDGSTKVPKNQRKTVNLLMKYASMTKWNKDQRQAVFVWRRGWRAGWNRLHNHAILPFFFLLTPAVDVGTKQLWSDTGGASRLTLQMWTWRRRRLPACLVYLFLFFSPKLEIKTMILKELCLLALSVAS